MNILVWLKDFFCRRRNIKRYGHYISLGYNCEIAYHFFQRHKFVESSLFTWTNNISINNLNNALENYESIASGKVCKDGVMWKCDNTCVRFHGIEPHNISADDEKSLEPYHAELVSRINHLKEKFKKQGTDGKKNLYLFLYLRKEEPAETIIKNIKRLHQNIARFCTNKFDLLVIFEKAPDLLNLETALDANTVFVRFVDKFAPEDDVTTKKYDKKSWDKIFYEFRPDFKLKKKKNFKFEATD